MTISFDCFGQRGTGKVTNEDAVLLDDQVFQGSVRDRGVIDTGQARHFAVADGGSSATEPRTSSRRGGASDEFTVIVLARTDGNIALPSHDPRNV